MTGKTHLIFGIGTAAATALTFSHNAIYGALGFIASAALGSLAPDIDNPKSTISKPIKLLSMGINKMFGHRGFIHTPIFCIALYFLFSLLLVRNGLSSYLCLVHGFIFGYAGHIFLDSLTAGGISFFYPFSRKRYKLLKIKTGGISEGIALVVGFAIAIVLAVMYLLLKRLF